MTVTEFITLTCKVTDAHAALKQEEPADAQVIELKDMDPTHTALDLKYQLKEHTGLNPNMCRLICRGKILKDNETLESSKVDSDSVVHIVKSAPKIADGEHIPLSEGYCTMTKSGLEAKLADPEAMEGMMKQFDKMMRSNHAKKDAFGAIANKCKGGAPLPDSEDAASMLENPTVQEMMQKIMQNPTLMEQMFADGGKASKSIANMMGTENFNILQEKVEEKVEAMPGGIEALLNEPAVKQAVKEVRKGSLDRAK